MIYDGFSQLKFVNTDDIKWAASDIESDVSNSDDECLDVGNQLAEIEYLADDIERYVDGAKNGFEQMLAFIKTFNQDEFASVYCEREWRSLRSYRFQPDEIAMVVVPRQIRNRKFFDRFIARDAKNIKLPRSIPIVPWEDLVEN